MNKRKLKDVSLNILIINASNRPKGNSHILLQKAVKELSKYENIAYDTLEIFNKNYGRYDDKKDVDELIKKWEWADNILFFIPNYTVGGPGSLYAAFERLSEYFAEDIENGVYNKTAGVLVQGSAKYGMAELAMESTFQTLAGIHTIPIYRLVAHIPDGTGPDEELLQNVENMVEESIWGGRLFKLSMEKNVERKAKILVVNAGLSNREIGDTIEERIVKRLDATDKIIPSVFRFKEEPIKDCHHCNKLCGKKLRCAFNDEFQKFFDKWIEADGIIWIVSGDQNGAPAEVHCVHDRLSETGFSTVSDYAIKHGVPYRFCRYTKPEGVVTYGSYNYGGQTQAQQFFVNVAEQRGNYYITGRTRSSLGPAAIIRQKSQLGCDKFYTDNIDSLTDDVSRIAKGIQGAKEELYEELPNLFYNSRTQMGIPDKEKYFYE
jgi:multimeric flavodoxin WrbA